MLRAIIALCCCAFSLSLSFPRLGWWPLAWIAFVPALVLVRHKSARTSFLQFYLFGLIFFFLTLGWFVYVTYPGAIVLMLYLSLYFGFFGLAVHYSKRMSVARRLLFLPSVWVILEWLRAHLIGGFNWVMLAHSQLPNYIFVQVADITGAYGVSFIVMLVNVLTASTITTLRDGRSAAMPALRQAQQAVFALVVLSFSYGIWQLNHVQPTGYVQVGLVQPNIAQSIKWDVNLQGWIVDQTIRLTRKVQAPVDLIVWPETSLPGVYSETPHLVKKIQSAASDKKVPLLFGAIFDDGNKYYNSAFLLASNGAQQGRYDKIHLVPFGEYIPMRPLLGWINTYVPLEDFQRGENYTLFTAGEGNHHFGTLICFEDTVGYLRRNFTLKGAEFFVNMTNDAWFKDTRAPYIHVASAAFASIENKRSLVRSANTGFSGIIDPFGRVTTRLSDKAGKETFVSGFAQGQVPMVDTITFYTKYGDIFALCCFAAILWAVGMKRSN